MLVRASRAFLRRRLPSIFAFYKRHVRRHVARGDPHYAIASWVNQGIALRGSVNLADVYLDREGAWFIDPQGLQWKFEPQIWGSTLGTATGTAHESFEIDAVCERLDRACVVVDVGANIGAFALPVTRATGARVIAIEPVSSTFALLNDNVRRNGAEHSLTTVRSALGETTGELIMTTDSQSANYVVPTQSCARAGEERVPVTTLDELLSKEPRIDLIKVDVEGLELNVMRGAQEILAQHAPAVLLEIESRWTARYGHKPENVFALMANAGYGYQTMTSAGPMRATTIAADLQRANNFLFTR